VLDDGGRLRGWVSLRHLSGAGGPVVADRARRFDETIPLGESLRRGLAEIVQHDAGWLPVLDGERYVGVLTPDGVYAALRRTAPRHEEPAAALLP
jgi:osmoprotectant transport system ATP-binding protein